MRRPALLAAILFVLAFDTAFLWQRAGGAYDSEFGGHPDEAAHYITGLMVRDYLAAGAPGSPMAYGQTYYAHYPKVALGVWPPAFYIAQSAWTLPFTPSRTSVLLLMAALAGTVALLIHLSLREEYGPYAAGAGALAFLCLPLVREYYSMVMAETLCAATMFAAALLWGRYLDRERPRDALLFGLCAALAILTKGTALALALMAPLALVFVRKWHLLRQPALWGGAALTAIVAGPWTWHFRDEGRLKGGWEQAAPTWSWTREALPYYGLKLLLGLTAVLTVLALIGLLGKLRNPGPYRGRWAAAAALIAAVVIFQSIIPCGKEARHLISALPAGILFAVAGLGTLHHAGRRIESRIADQRDTGVPPVGPAGSPPADPEHRRDARATFRRIARVGFRNLRILCAASIGLAFATALLHDRTQKGFTGFRPVAETILGGAHTAPPRILISSDARGEGMFISELAMREPRPGSTIERASKLLATGSWSGDRHSEKFQDPDALHRHLAAARLDFIVLDDAIPAAKRRPYHSLLRRTLEEYGHTFQLAGEYPIERAGQEQAWPIRLYRVRGGAMSNE